jgi:hypothetical protein
MKNTLCIPDLHCPYQHIDALAFLCAVRDRYKTTQSVCLGDECDAHALSYHETNPNLPSAGDELDMAKEVMQEIHKEFPVMRLCESNHGSMIYRKAITHGIPKGMLKTYEEIYQVKGWSWHEEVIDEIKGGLMVCFRHSFGQTIHTALPRQGGVCCVQGHFHSKSNVEMLRTPTRLLFGMSVGWLGDDEALAFRYNRISLARPVLSCGVIVNGQPIIVPMWTDSKRRWTGKLS